MGVSRLLGRVVFAAVVVAAGGAAAIHYKDVRAFYLDIYPTDPAKREALDLCFTQDHEFNRLDGAARENCYRRALSQITVAGFAPDVRAAVNPIDLDRAAAAGHMPRNDVRRTEQTQDALHLPH